MNLSFLATIAFALLALFCAFLANLLALVFTDSLANVWGVMAAITAMGASYGGQYFFTRGAEHMERHRWMTAPGYEGPVDDEAWEKADTANFYGTCAQITAVVLAAAATALFWLGVVLS